VSARAAARRAALLARDALLARGIEVRRTSTGVRRTLPAVIAHHRGLGLAPATVIDVGVGPGTPELYDGFPGAKLVLVEPLHEYRGDLDRIRRVRHAEVVFAAAGPAPGEIEIAVHRVPACSSMIGARRGDEDQVARRTVPVVRLDDLAGELGLSGPYVVKADVEGAELDVLAGAESILPQSELVLLEVSLFELVPGAPQFHDVLARMHEYGFVVADIYNGHNRPLDGALAQVDVAFVQEHGRFRTSHSYATAAQADDLYRSWGF
jgi:FkbM family methyltransferase